MSPRRIRRTIFWLAAVLLAAVILPPLINANRFRNQLASTISRSLGRPVQMGDVHFRLVPQPGFVVSNLAIADDPNFSSEPVLRSESVTAALRITSLWRGRLEISKLTFDYPSLNLVRAANGHWNVESVLQQASQVPAAPTARVQPGQRPRFPYIEASNGRINFRVGQEKRPHALMEADFSLWLESENQWNTRLEARPTRTDANLSDTGTVRVAGWFRRGDTLANTQMNLEVTAEKAQLGQWTSLILGSDRGWRGGGQIEAKAEGTVTDFNFNSHATVRDFHRHDVANPDTFDINLDCKGRVTVPGGAPAPVVGLQCNSSSLGGTLSVVGDVSAHQRPGFNLNVIVNDGSARALVNLYRHLKKDVPADLNAEGTLSAEFHFGRPFGGEVTSSGGGKVAGLTLSSDAHPTALTFTDFAVLLPALAPKTTDKRTGRLKLTLAPNELIVEGASTKLGAALPVTLTARLSSQEVNVQARGEAELEELASAAAMLGFADRRYRFAGSAVLDLNVRGIFKDFAAPVVTGTAQLRNLRTQVDGVAAPLLLLSADLRMTPEKLSLEKLTARLEGTDTVAEGSVVLPLQCPDGECASTFDLKTARLDLDEFNRVLNPRYRNTGWLSAPLRFFEGRPVKTSRLMTLRSRGTIAIGKLTIKNLLANNVTAGLAFDRGKVSLTDVRAAVFGGKHSGSWQADLTGPEPEYRGRGSVEKVALAQVNSILRVSAGSGTVGLIYDLSLRGADAESVRKSAAGTAQFRWTNGAWRPPNSPALQFSTWTGKLNINNGLIEVSPSVMQTASGPYQVTGHVGLDRSMNLRLDGRKDQVLVTGSLSESRVAVEAAAQLPAAIPASNLENAPQKNAPPKNVHPVKVKD